MSMIRNLVKPDISRYITGEETEDEYSWGQVCAALPLVYGALAISERASEDGSCMDCVSVRPLLSSFIDAVEKLAGDAISKRKCKPLPRISFDELKKKVG